MLAGEMPESVAWYEHWFPGLPPGMTPPGEAPGRGLYPFQLESLLARERAVILSYFGLEGPKMLLEIWARQVGKNHTDALFSHKMMTHLGALQVARRQPMGYAVVSAPTWDQVDQSKRRLEQVMAMLGKETGKLNKREGSLYWLHGLLAGILFKSVGAGPNAKGETANLYQVVNECQDTDKQVYDDSLAPMRSSTGAPVMFQGTQGPEECLTNIMLEVARQQEEDTGEKLVYIVDGEMASEFNPAYAKHFRDEERRLTRDHDVFRANYLCLPCGRSQNFFQGLEDRARGQHLRGEKFESHKLYVGGVDFCGAAETEDTDDLWNVDRIAKRDSTVATVGELTWEDNDGILDPVLHIVDLLYLPNLWPDSTVERVMQFLFERWRCSQVVLDARGVGEGPAYKIHQRRPGNTTLNKGTADTVSVMGYRLQAAVFSGRLKMFRKDSSPGAPDGSPEYQDWWIQARHLRKIVKPAPAGSTPLLRWAAPVKRVMVNGVFQPVHDDAMRSAAYCLEAGYDHLALLQRDKPREAPSIPTWDAGGGYM